MFNKLIHILTFHWQKRLVERLITLFALQISRDPVWIFNWKYQRYIFYVQFCHPRTIRMKWKGQPLHQQGTVLKIHFEIPSERHGNAKWIFKGFLSITSLPKDVTKRSITPVLSDLVTWLTCLGGYTQVEWDISSVQNNDSKMINLLIYPNIRLPYLVSNQSVREQYSRESLHIFCKHKNVICWFHTCNMCYVPPTPHILWSSLLSTFIIKIRGGEIKSPLMRRAQNRNLTTLYESRDQLARVPRTLGNGDLINTSHEEICQAI